MKRIFYFLIILLLGVANSMAQSSKIKSWTGSGFALNNGYLVTNYHVANGAGSILVYQVDDSGARQAYSASMVAHDAPNDIAILKISDNNFKGFGQIPYTIKSVMADVGESVWTLGYPMTDIMGYEVKFTDGKISARSGIDGSDNEYQISVPIQHGNSGGPLFDENGNIVGITSSALNRDLKTENVNYAIKSTYLKALIDRSLPASEIPQGASMLDKKLTDQIKLAQKFVFYIECTSGINNKLSEPTTPNGSQGVIIPSLTVNQALDIIRKGKDYEKQKAFNALVWWGNNASPIACGYLGLLYEHGIYVSKDIKKAIEWFQKGERIGDVACTYELGCYYYEGEYLSKDIDKAVELFLKVADKGGVQAYASLGGIYMEKGDYNNALYWLEKGCSVYDESAFDLIFQYHFYIEEDTRTAYRYLKAEMEAREQGIIFDVYKEDGYRFDFYMGYYYEAGLAPIQKDIKKAKQWYRKAAQKGDSDSKNRLMRLEVMEDLPNSETIVPKRYEVYDDCHLVLDKVILSEKSTILECYYRNTEYLTGGWFNISKKAYLIDLDTNKKYYLRDVLNIAIAPAKTSIDYQETIRFSLIFDNIPKSCNRLEFVESPDSSWHLYEIILK